MALHCTTGRVGTCGRYVCGMKTSDPVCSATRPRRPNVTMADRPFRKRLGAERLPGPVVADRISASHHFHRHYHSPWLCGFRSTNTKLPHNPHIKSPILLAYTFPAFKSLLILFHVFVSIRPTPTIPLKAYNPAQCRGRVITRPSHETRTRTDLECRVQEKCQPRDDAGYDEDGCV